MIEIPIIYAPLLLLLFLVLITFIFNNFSFGEPNNEFAFFLKIITYFVGIIVFAIYLVKGVSWLCQHIKFV